MSQLELDSKYREKPLEDFKQGRVMSQLVFPRDSLGIMGRPPAGGLGQRPSLGKRCKARSVGEPGESRPSVTCGDWAAPCSLQLLGPRPCRLYPEFLGTWPSAGLHPP